MSEIGTNVCCSYKDAVLFELFELPLHEAIFKISYLQEYRYQNLMLMNVF